MVSLPVTHMNDPGDAWSLDFLLKGETTHKTEEIRRFQVNLGTDVYIWIVFMMD